MTKNIYILGKLKILFYLIICFELTSCIITPESPRYHPTVISFTPASVVINYSLNDLQEATNLAQQFCSTINKDAQYTGTQYIKIAEAGFFSNEIQAHHAFFNCVGSGRSRKDGQSIINNFK
ncbi:hypothetical protein [Rickettsia tamurae]|uniref:hypothetical protein n=1 Tax=Rickettsia tamurae TaxID=334545 RepID=UPI00050A0E56|nr:hypothetical protein [Rickettsia tamurae]